MDEVEVLRTDSPVGERKGHIMTKGVATLKRY